MSTTIKILIVEHDPYDIELMEYELRKSGIEYISEIVQMKLHIAMRLGTLFRMLYYLIIHFLYLTVPKPFKLKSR